MKTPLSRRHFLKGCASGAGLFLAFRIAPSCFECSAVQDILNGTPERFQPNIWLSVTPDDLVTIRVSKCDIGQGVYTSLPMIVADELGAAWDHVRYELAPVADEYRDPVWGEQVTAGSASISHLYEPLRKAGAAAREMLAEAAAGMFHVPRDRLVAGNSALRCVDSGLSLSYGKLCARAAKLPLPSDPPLKRRDQFTFIGKDLPRLDIVEKVNGSAVYGMDVRIPGMLHAAVDRPPVYGGRVLGCDMEAALRVPGVEKVGVIDSGLAVCAASLAAAWEGRNALRTRWSTGKYPWWDTDSAARTMQEHLDRQGVNKISRGDVEGAMKKASVRLRADYVLPYLAHCPMEPPNCTVHLTGDRCRIWASCQNQTAMMDTAVEETGLRPHQIDIHILFSGGSFGRRYEVDFVREAIQTARVCKKPVRLMWTREEDIKNDFYRPGNAARIEAGLDSRGRLLAWRHKVAAPSVYRRIATSLLSDGIDPAAVEAIHNSVYDFPAVIVDYVEVKAPPPVGFWRSVGNSHNAFTIETFMDELAGAAGRDPIDFRMDLLDREPRARRVLELVAARAGWGKKNTKGRYLGAALHLSVYSYVAKVAEVSVNRSDGTIRVHRIVCAVDCGQVVNRDIVRAQMEGGIIYGLSAALKEEVRFAAGGVVSENFNDYEPLRIHEAPDIEVIIVDSREKPTGVGEIGVPSAAPAVANAVSAACGVRIRRLPMTPDRMVRLLSRRVG
ncbi:MAG TPA: xanthine dehydrogenase family protein molybdopterin-binding subunit [Thermodesulfobacteriaceae bacterium]|nr:xanthine dehydrogenase family protein molybdopterin-binding subunit [Thermodesulfobacteriaceae bacterium]